jgi:hypothetical protein
MAVDTPHESTEGQTTPAEAARFDVNRCRERFGILRDAFAMEQDSHDYVSLQRVTADVLRPLLYTGAEAKVDLDCLLRNLGAEFIDGLVEQLSNTPVYYPIGEKAWVDDFPVIESRERMDNRFCAFHIIAIMLDTVPALATLLAEDREFQTGLLRLMFNMYIRAVNPLGVEDDAGHHQHIPSSSAEPKVWIPQWRTIISCLVLLAAGYGGEQTLKESWKDVVAETQAGAEKVKVKEGMIAEILLRQASILQDKGAPALDEEERRTLVEFSRLAVLIAAPDDSSPPTVVSHVQKELTTRDWRVACGGCGIVHPSETNLVKCDNCPCLFSRLPESPSTNEALRCRQGACLLLRRMSSGTLSCQLREQHLISVPIRMTGKATIKVLADVSWPSGN